MISILERGRPIALFLSVIGGMVAFVAWPAGCSSDSGTSRSGFKGGNGDITLTGTYKPGTIPTNATAQTIAICTDKDAGCYTLPTNCADGGAAIRVKSLGPQLGLLAETTSDGCSATVDWTGGAIDAGTTTPAYVPPEIEPYVCPEGTLRVHLRDMWSKTASPTLGVLDARPLAVGVTDPNYQHAYGARQESAGCDWYSVCVPPATITGFELISAAVENLPMMRSYLTLSSLPLVLPLLPLSPTCRQVGMRRRCPVRSANHRYC